jgi:4-amino-4-deoxy-L-arabinose transferase-like glycosyltransferase
MTPRLIERALLTVIVLTYVVIGTLFALRVPLWQAPDEPAHYNYIRQVAANGCCPTIEQGDWDSAYLDAIKSARFSTESVGERLPTIQYEDHQPPLYYLLATPIYVISGGNPYTLRLFSVALGAGLLIAAWGAVRLIASPPLALAAVGFMAFLPQHVAMMAAINNDSLAELIVALTLFGCAAYLGNGNGDGLILRTARRPLTLGLLLGLAFLTKLTIYPLIAVIGVTLLLRHRRDVPALLRTGVLVAVPALLLGSLLWLRNLGVYGGVDVLAQAAHDRVVTGQPQTTAWVARRGVDGWLSDALQTTFRSFWGQFGWMGVPMTDGIYALLLGFTLFVISGAALWFWRVRLGLLPSQWQALLVFALTSVLALSALIYWNLKFVQFQGRYLYPGLIGIAVFAAAGVMSWISLIAANRSGWRRLYWLAPLAMFAFAALDVYALFRIILPQLAP